MTDVAENKLRDLLSTHLEVLEPNLTLVSKEAYIPNSLGTRSFIDLLAIDTDKRYVLIELKRSNEAAREAIHEIYKYFEAVKAHLGVREHEVRAMVVSTEWKELIVPFSRFLSDSNLSISGFSLSVDDNHVLSAQLTEPIAINNGHYLAPWHHLNRYYDADSLQRGIAEHEQTCAIKGITDYVILIMKAAPNFVELARAQFIEMYKDSMSKGGISITDDQAIAAAESLGNYEYIAYFAMRLMKRDEGMVLIKDMIASEEVSEYFDDAGEEDGLRFMHETLSAMDPCPHRDYYEIGYAAKLQWKLDQEDWSIVELRRYGSFARNKALTDEAILGELCGKDGTTGQRLTRSIKLSDPSQYRSTIDSIRTCLEDNPRWQGHLLRFVEEIREQYPDNDVYLHIYNPCTGLVTISNIALHEDGILYVPMYRLSVQSDQIERVYFGYLGYESSKISFKEILEKYYNGRMFPFLCTLRWGGYEDRDTDILEDIGLVYRSARLDITHEKREFYRFQDERWKKSEKIDVFSGLQQLFSQRQEFMDTLLTKLTDCWNGSFIVDNDLSDSWCIFACWLFIIQQYVF